MDSAEERARNRATLDRYLGKTSEPSSGPSDWGGTADPLPFLSDDFSVQVPFGPPGLFRTMRREDMLPMLEWVDRSFSAPHLTVTDIEYETSDPRLFWQEDNTLGATRWRGGFIYTTRHIIKRQFDEAGKLRYECEYFTPIQKYRTDLTPIPEWDYNAERVRAGLEPVVLPPKGRTHTMPLLRPALPQARPDEAAQGRIEALVEKLLAEDRFLEGYYDATGRWIPDLELTNQLAEDFFYELPWSPDGMLKVYDNEERTSFNQFLAKSMTDLRIVKKYFWRTPDPTVFIWEDEREATVTWRGGGQYRNRHVGVIRFASDGKLLSWCEYFSPIQMFTMDATEWPEWSYNNERARVGLAPVPLTWEQTHGIPALP